MKKSTKGAFAAGTAAVLLMGGAGTMAFWSDAKTVNGGEVTAGRLALGAGLCGAWTLDGGTAFGAETKIVPGDTITKVCEFAITAVGDHLTGDLKLTGGNNITITGGNPDANGANITASSAFMVGSAATTAVTQTKITSADNDKKVFATITVAFPFGTDSTNNAQNGNGTQSLKAALNDLTVSVTQTTH